MRSKIEEITSTGKSAEIYTGLLGNLTYKKPHLFINDAYTQYRKNNPDNPSVNGRIFEFLICETLAQENIEPFYYQAKFKQVPNADFDVVLYNEKAPVALTMKTSLRERYKQADLEGWALKQVYRLAASYLITLSADEARNTQKKIKAGDIAGLVACVVASTPEYDELLAELKKNTYTTVEPVTPLEGRAYLAPSI